MMRLIAAVLLACMSLPAEAQPYWRDRGQGNVAITGGTISGVGHDTMASDAAARASVVGGSNAYPQAVTNTSGGALRLSPGIGQRFATVVDYSLIDLAVDTVTLTVDGTATVGTATAATQNATNFIAATSNAVTATNICTWAATISGVASATAVGSSCYVTFSAGTRTATIATSMAAGEGTVTSGTDGALTIVGGTGTNTLDNVVIGGTTPAAITGTTITATLLNSNLVSSTGGLPLQFSNNNGTHFWQLSGTYPPHLTPKDDNLYDIGASGATRPRTGYFGTSVVSPRFDGGSTGGYLSFSNIAGAGPSITAGTATTDVNALSATQTWNGGAVAFRGINQVITDTASAAGSKDLYLARSTGQAIGMASLSELTTIAAAATTDTVIQIPANAIVLGVSVRVTTVIPTAATFTVIGTTSSTAFQTGASVSTAATTTDAGTKACPYLNTTAQTIRITPNLTPADNTGRVRVTIHYVEITPPTS